MINPRARVVYVDHDPAVVVPGADLLRVSHATLLLNGLRALDEVLTVAGRVLDLDRPIGVLMVGVLNFIPDEQRPHEFLASYMAACPAGSYLT